MAIDDVVREEQVGDLVTEFITAFNALYESFQQDRDPLSPVKWRTDFTGTLATSSGNVNEHWINGTLRGYDNEWGAKRGRAGVYPTYADALVRAIIEAGDYVGTPGAGANAIEIVDRNFAAGNQRQTWGRAWANGQLIRKGVAVNEVIVWRTGDTDPTTGGVTRPEGVRYIFDLGSADPLPSWAVTGDIVLRPGTSGGGGLAQDTVLTDPGTEYWADVEIVDDGSSTASWPNRFQIMWTPQSGTAHPTWWNNEYGEARGIPAKSNTVGARWFAAVDATDYAARDMTIPVLEITNQRDGTRTTLMAVYGDGDIETVKDLIVGKKIFLDKFNMNRDETGWSYEPLANVTTAASLTGHSIVAVGTATASGALASTNGQTRTRHLKYRVTTAAVNAIASIRQANSTHARVNGFSVVLCAGPDTGVTTSGSTDRFWMGLRASTSAPTDVEPSSLVNAIGLGYDAADTTMQIMHNDGSGTATKVNTGMAVPATDSSGMFKLHLWCEAGSSTVQYVVTNLTDGTEFSGTISTDLVASTTFMSWQAYHSVGATSSVVGLALGSQHGRDAYK